jgi:ATP phosphoribosyltransferase
VKVLKIVLPKGHLWNQVIELINQAGYGLTLKNDRSYLINSNDPELIFRVHRAQNIGPLVEEGRYDLGITGYDWLVEHGTKVKDLLDLKLGKVNVVVAVPQKYGVNRVGFDAFKQAVKKIRGEGRTSLIVASEYANITGKLFQKKLRVPTKIIHSYGATETFIDVADFIVDCTETGETLRQNGWSIVYKLFESTARLVANRESLKNPWKKNKIADFQLLVAGAKDAKGLKLFKMNVPEKYFERVMKVLPAMKSPTVSRLHGRKSSGYAVEVAVTGDQVVKLIPILKKSGATDILEVDIKKVIQ